MKEIGLIILGAVIGFLSDELRHFLQRKRTKLDQVVDRYVNDVHSIDDPEKRLQSLARCGVLGFKTYEFKKFIVRVQELGCTHPYKGTVIESFDEDTVLKFIRRMIRDKIPLSDQEEVLRHFIFLVEEQNGPIPFGQ